VPELTDEMLNEIDRKTAVRDRTEPRIDSATYDVQTANLTLSMRGGAAVLFDPRILPSLQGATPAQLANEA